MRILILIFMILFIGCDKKQEVPVVIGLSSNYSSIAKNIKNGILLAADEEPNVEFKFYDNRGDKYITKQIDKDLIFKNTPLVIGHITSSISKSAVLLFDDTNTILFSPTTSTKELAQMDDNFIRIQPIKDFNSMKSVLELLYKISKKNINIMYDKNNRAYAQSLINSFLDKKNKYVKVNKIIAIEDNNFDISKIDKNIPIFIIGSTKLSANLVVTLKQNGFHSLIIVSGSAFSNDFIKMAKEYAEGVLFFSTFNPNSDDKKYLQFKERFIAKFGYEPGSFELKGYEIAKITAKVINKKDIKHALINHTFDGLQGKIHIDKYGDTQRETHIYIVNNGNFEKVK